MLLVLLCICVCSVLTQRSPSSDGILNAQDFGDVQTWLSTNSDVRHMEADLFKPGNILFSDQFALHTSDVKKSVSVVVGAAATSGHVYSKSTSARFGHIFGFAQINSTSVIISDYNNHCLKYVSRLTSTSSHYAGSCTTSGFKDGLSAQFNSPTGIIFHKGLLYLADYGNSAIRVITVATKSTSTLQNKRVSSPHSLALGPDEKFLFVTVSGGLVKVDRLTGKVTALSFKIFDPYGLAFIFPDALVIADVGRNQLDVIDLSSNTSSLICKGGRATVNGDVDKCQLYNPISVLLLNSTLFVGTYKSIRSLPAPKKFNECALGTHDCDNNANCINTDRSYICQCKLGFKTEGKRCYDINECVNQTDVCSENAQCVNTPGSYSCHCNHGYTGDGFTCIEINECVKQTNVCSENAQCGNTPGSYICQCNHGYIGDGFTCTAPVCPGNITGVTQGKGSNYSDVKVIVGDGTHTLRLPIGVHKYDINLPFINCTTYITVIDAVPAEKALILKAQYKLPCDKFTGVTAALIRSVSRHANADVERLCGCKILDGISTIPDATCSDEVLEVTWRTSTVLNSEDSQFNKTSTRLLKDVAAKSGEYQSNYWRGFLRLPVVNSDPPIIHPLVGDDGLILEPGFILACHNLLTYDFSKGICTQ